MLTAQQILSSKKCGDLFSSADKQVVIAEYREIARAYHPDISSDPQANEVMAKVNQLYEEALKLIESGAWEVSKWYGLGVFQSQGNQRCNLSPISRLLLYINRKYTAACY